MKKIMFLSSFTLMSLFLGESKVLAQCANVNFDCRAAGYTQTSCPSGGVRCPTDNSLWYCPQNTAFCEVGYILNSDMSCTKNKVSGKTPIAVVAYLDGKGGGQAISLEDLPAQVMMASGVTIPDSYEETSFAMTGVKSCEKTQLLINSGDKSKFPAAWAAYEYAPAAAPNTKGKWCIPDVGVLFYARRAYAAEIDAAIKNLNAEEFTDYYWTTSLTEKRGMYSFHFVKDDGITTSYGYYDRNYKIRPVIEF